MTAIKVLIVSKGHAYDHNAFLAMFEEDSEVTTTLVEQPAAQVVLRPENVGEYDAVLFYDMSGIPGIGLLHDGANDTGIASIFITSGIHCAELGTTFGALPDKDRLCQLFEKEGQVPTHVISTVRF